MSQIRRMRSYKVALTSALNEGKDRDTFDTRTAFKGSGYGFLILKYRFGHITHAFFSGTDTATPLRLHAYSLLKLKILTFDF